MFKITISNSSNPFLTSPIIKNSDTHTSVNVCGNVIKNDLRKKIEHLFIKRGIHVLHPDRNNVNILTDNKTYYEIMKHIAKDYLIHIYN